VAPTALHRLWTLTKNHDFSATNDTTAIAPLQAALPDTALDPPLNSESIDANEVSSDAISATTTITTKADGRSDENGSDNNGNNNNDQASAVSTTMSNNNSNNSYNSSNNNGKNNRRKRNNNSTQYSVTLSQPFADTSNAPRYTVNLALSAVVISVALGGYAAKKLRKNGALSVCIENEKYDDIESSRRRWEKERGRVTVGRGGSSGEETFDEVSDRSD